MPSGKLGPDRGGTAERDAWLMRMRVADYIARTLADRGVRHVFMVSGGGAMFLNDAFGSEHRLKYVCNHHEQASAMAAEAYARITGQVGVVNVTAGPGAIVATPMNPELVPAVFGLSSVLTSPPRRLSAGMSSLERICGS